ncbi:EAL domain-containing protein [Aureimonas mangrovi]|uniref:EAL domain-containing protein n=1 Tax=Aureimonas mangrovi TaxID=2758041 RepID=UPI00163D6FA8|nr:EAL domain-containing protein [Aureimonas mangrovi]
MQARSFLRPSFWAYAPITFWCLLAIAVLSLADVIRPHPGPTGHILVSVLAAAALFALVRAHVERARRRIAAGRRDLQRQHDLSHDVGTGLMIRRVFLDACERRIAMRGEAESLAYFAVDMDFLKTLNDSLGHKVGDAALRRLAEALRDLAGDEDAVIGRLGGDEFAILAPCADEAAALQKAQALLSRIRISTLVHGQEIALSATIGIAMLPAHTIFLAEALQFSDLALYEGKNAGRNRAVLFTKRMLGQFRQERQIERELRIGLLRNELTQLYIPVVDAQGRMVGARSVVEWQSKWLGTVPSETFLRVAETTNLIDHLGEWSLRRACEDARGFGRLSVAFPLSSAQLRREGVLDMVSRVLAETGTEPTRLIALVNRMATTTGDAEAKRRLAALRALGIRVSIDDLGAIVCDFDRLRDFPVDIVRVRPEQIGQLGASEIDNTVVSALTSVCKAMGLEVVADGVRDPDQLLLARTAGCDLFSGPCFSGPVDASAIAADVAREEAPRIRLPVSGRAQAPGQTADA